MDHAGKGEAVNILIVKLSAIGDVIHTLPSLAGLRNLYPDAHITWVIEESSADLIKNHPYLDRVITSQRKRWMKDVKAGKMMKVLKEVQAFIAELRSRSYDLVIDFHGLFKSAVIVFLSKGKRKLGYNSLQELSGLFLNEKIREDMGKHAVDRYLDFIRYLGGTVERPEFFIPIQEENRYRIDEFLKRYHIDRQKHLVAVNPVALWATKLWQNEKFAQLCDRIIEELSSTVIFTGSDREPLASIQSCMKNKSINVGGETTLRDLACLYQHSDLLITTDSGPMHLAAAVGTPVVALFGPTDPARTGPYGEGHTVIRKNLPCSPCFLKKCDSMNCMSDITTEEVFEAVRAILSKKGKKL